jgi:hypothetical protein
MARFRWILLRLLFLLIVLSLLYNVYELNYLKDYTASMQKKYNLSFDDPLTGGGLKGSVNASGDVIGRSLDEIKKIHRPDNSTFVFGPTSLDVKIREESVFHREDDW